MSARDAYHDIVVDALEDDGWTVTDDPLFLRVGTVKVFIDIGAEKLIAAHKGTTKIAVEVKTFLHESNISKSHRALGQYLNYLLVLETEDPERILYLAIPRDAYKEFFSWPLIQKSIQRHQVKLIIYDEVKQEIVEWIS